jgi:hypothetical protein
MSVQFIWYSAQHASIPFSWLLTINLYAWALPNFPGQQRLFLQVFRVLIRLLSGRIGLLIQPEFYGLFRVSNIHGLVHKVHMFIHQLCLLRVLYWPILLKLCNLTSY